MRSAWLAIAAIGLALSACNTSPRVAEDDRRVVMAYFLGGEIPADMPVDKLTHICYAFGNVHEDGSVHVENDSDARNLDGLCALRARNPQLRVLLSLGGWNWSKYFSNAALTVGSRKRFVDSAVDIVTQHKLDGLDIDWEYPGHPGDGNVFRPEDGRNFTLLLQDLRERLDSLRDARRRQLTVATGAFESYLQRTEPKAFEQYVDYVNLMTYDFSGFGSAFTGHHTNLRHAPGDKNGKLSAEDAVSLYVAYGIPARKLVLGCAFFGKGWEGGVAPGGTGLFAAVDGKSSKAIGVTYAQLVDGYIDKNGYARHWDAESLAPYLWNPAKQAFITYDDEESVAAKCRYVKQAGLAGAMFWEYHGDKDNCLLNAICRTLSSRGSD